MEIYYFESPHKQIVEDFMATVVKVIDGDTIRVQWEERDFDFPIRLARIAAPELDEEGGVQSQSWLEKEILGEDVLIKMTKQRVEKWGRLLAEIFFRGLNMGQVSMDRGYSLPWERKEQHAISVW